MGVPLQAIEESLSVAYVSAIVARAGATFHTVSSDYGVDARIARIDSLNGKLMDMGVAFEMQLKASVQWQERDETIIYDLDAETYNKLVHRHENSTTPCYLVLLCLPKEETEWITCSDTALELRRCCYYFRVEGRRTENTATVRIKIPRAQRLTPDAVEELIKRVRDGEVL